MYVNVLLSSSVHVTLVLFYEEKIARKFKVLLVRLVLLRERGHRLLKSIQGSRSMADSGLLAAFSSCLELSYKPGIDK